MDQLIIPKLIYFFILNTHLVDIELICKEKFCLGHWWELKGPNENIFESTCHIFLLVFLFFFSFLFRVGHILQRAKVSKKWRKKNEISSLKGKRDTQMKNNLKSEKKKRIDDSLWFRRLKQNARHHFEKIQLNWLS